METATPAAKGRGKAKLYDPPLVSFQNEKVAIAQLKEPMFGAQWTRGNSNGNVIWFKCKGCSIKMKLSIDNNNHYALSLEMDYNPESHVHAKISEESNEIVPIGIPHDIKKKFCIMTV